jgi:glycosidase
VLAASLLLTAGQAQTSAHTFTFTAPEAKAVFLAGTFNGWRTDRTPMVRGDDGLWKATLNLPFGKHYYKFVVDGNWTTDPAAKIENDGGGNLNSVLLVFPPDYSLPARPDDGVVAESALLHETSAPSLNWDRGRLTLTLRVRPNDLKRVQIVANGRKIGMRDAGGDDLYTTYRAELPWDRKQAVRYSFLLDDGKRERSYGAYTVDPESFRAFEVPSWVEKTVFYQIFPDRFANGNTANDPKDVAAWDAKPTYRIRMGGDAAGVGKHLDHLSGLGIGAVYFNPVFKAPSNHRYDAEDYRTIDPDFGTNSEFGSLTRELRKHGIRTVMDFVFNHTATTFGPFMDIRKNGASSEYRDWYYVESFPIKVESPPNYQAWYGFPSMPKLNLSNPATKSYMLGLVDFWTKTASLDGIRLDVANEVDPNFWRALRPHAKNLNPQMWIVGEVWGDGSPWLKGDQWDSVMNYQFRDACVKFIAQGTETPTQFAGSLMRVYNSYAPQVSRNMMNLVSSHDTPRFLTLAGGNRDLAKLAATVQFTWVGAPSIYYGEELGMEGDRDPDNRRGMRWDLARDDNDMLRHYRKLVSLRNRSRALQSGDPLLLAADDRNNTVAYARTLDREAAVVALNRSDKSQTISFTLPTGSAFAEARRSGFIDALSGRRYRPSGDMMSIELEPLSAAVLLKADRAASNHSAIRKETQ